MENLKCYIFSGVLVATAFTYASLNYSGFCFAKMRYLSDEEKFRILFEAFNSRKTVPIKTKDKGTQNYEQIKYESFEQFIEMNPNCCTIDPGGPYDLGSPDVWDRVTGYDSAQVIVITSRVHYIDENGEEKSQKMKTETILQNCGRKRFH